MKTYLIHEDNIDRLESKLKRIQNKCINYGCEFHYQRLGEVFQPVYDEESNKSVVARFIEVEAEGTAVVNGWRFVATIDHTEAGNIIRQCDYSLDVPVRYRDAAPFCEHCQRIRSRKDTFLVYNDETQEWKQVGRSCLCDFTGGLSAEQAASYISWFDSLIQGETYSSGFGSSPVYFPTEDVLRYAVECVNRFGFHNRDSEYPTSYRVFNYYAADNYPELIGYDDQQLLQDEMKEVQFNPNRPSVEAVVADAMKYVKESDDSSSYMSNLKVICNLPYVKRRDYGILVSLIPTYYRHLDREEAARKRKEAMAKEAASSKHVGSVGERITIQVSSMKVLSSYESMYGLSILYKIVDTDNNVYTWSTSSCLDLDVDRVESLVGTVKAHTEFRGVQQTVLTRCKVTLKEDVDEGTDPDCDSEIDEAIKDFCAGFDDGRCVL